MADPTAQSAEDLDAQLLRDHYLRRRMRLITVVGSLLIYLIVDSFAQFIFRARPPLFHIAVDGLFALILGASVLVAFGQYEAKRLTAMQAMVRERRERDQLTTQLATVRETARAVAHGLNQPLAVIRGYAELMQTTPPGESIADDVTAIVRATDRAAGLVRDLLHVTRYATQAAADGRPMLNLSESVDPPAILT